MNSINSKFNEIYCILSVDNALRVENTKNVFEKYDIQNVKYVYTFQKPIYKNIRKNYPSIITDYYDNIYLHDKNIYNRVFDLALNHYNIIKSAYLRGLNNILIFEDDINFIVNKNILNQIINKMPDDYDIIKFHNGGDENFLEITNKNNIKYSKNLEHPNRCYFSTIMVAYSKNGMKSYIDMIESNGIAPADIYIKNIVNKTNINLYSLTTYFIKPIFKTIINGENTLLNNIHKAIFNLQGRLGNHFFIISAMIYLMKKYNYKCKLVIPEYIFIWQFDNGKKYPKYIQYIKDNNLLDENNSFNNDNQLKDYSDYISNHIEYCIDLDNILQNNNEDISFNCTMFQNKKYFLEYKDEIKNIFINNTNNTEIYKKMINNDSVFISVRRGDYLEAGFYILNEIYYIDVYNKYFEGKNIFISSDDIEWCKNNLTIDKFNKCKNINYIENLSSLEIITIAQYFNNYICSNSTFSMMCNLFSNYNKPKCVCVKNVSYSVYRDNTWTDDAIIYDISTEQNKKYIDEITKLNYDK